MSEQKPDFAHTLADVKTSIEQLRTFMSEGNAASLDDLAPKLDALNAGMARLGKEDGQKYVPDLLEINDALAELAKDFARQKEGSKAAIEQLSTRLKASTAYARSAAAAGKNDESA